MDPRRLLSCLCGPAYDHKGIPEGKGIVGAYLAASAILPVSQPVSCCHVVPAPGRAPPSLLACSGWARGTERACPRIPERHADSGGKTATRVEKALCYLRRESLGPCPWPRHNYPGCRLEHQELVWLHTERRKK